MRLVKNLGRIFLVLTEEERFIEPDNIRAVLFISLGNQSHSQDALKKIKNRFNSARVNEIRAKNRIELIKRLWLLKEEQFSAIVTLSLDPVTIFLVRRFFHCYFLLYNNYGQRFLIRRKTLYEFFAGRRGADKSEADWKVSQKRLVLAAFLRDIVFLCLIGIKNIFRGIWLFLYLSGSLLLIFMRKAWFSVFYRKRAL